MNLVDIKDYEGLYSFDLNTNQVWGHTNQKFRKPSLNGQGYYQLNLCKNGKKNNLQYHRLVFQYNNLDKDINNLQIDHIDRNKLNNNLDNLRMATHSQNRQNTKVNKNNKLNEKNISITKRFINGKEYIYYRVAIKKYQKYFKTLEEAMEHRNLKVKELFKDFSYNS